MESSKTEHMIQIFLVGEIKQESTIPNVIGIYFRLHTTLLRHKQDEFLNFLLFHYKKTA